jgi:hypothetical protein
MERSWLEARRGITGRRKTSYAAAAVDVLAAAPVISATSLAGILGIAVKNAIRILDELQAAEIAIEVTHRSKRRLFGLKVSPHSATSYGRPTGPIPTVGPADPGLMSRMTWTRLSHSRCRLLRRSNDAPSNTRHSRRRWPISTPSSGAPAAHLVLSGWAAPPQNRRHPTGPPPAVRHVRNVGTSPDARFVLAVRLAAVLDCPDRHPSSLSD